MGVHSWGDRADTLDTSAGHCDWESPFEKEGVRMEHSRCLVRLAGGDGREGYLDSAWEMNEVKPMDGEGAYRDGHPEARL